MSRVIAVTACGFMLAACSATMPSLSLDFMKSAPQAETLAIESEPPGGGGKNLVRPELSYALPAPGPARQRVLRHAYAEWLSAADRIGASGGRWRSCRATARAQPGSRGPAGGGPAEEAGSEEKEAQRGHGRRAGTLTPSGDGTIRDQLSLASTIISVAAEAEEPAIEKRLWRTASERNTKMLAGWQVGSTLTPGASPGASFTILPLELGPSLHRL